MNKPVGRGGVVGIGAATFFASAVSGGIAYGQTKTFIDYYKPTPITCSPLSSATWGAAGVLPRDTCNGIESARGAGVSPEYYYWDGKIIRAKDGAYHMFMSTWAGTAGFNPGWTNSESYHAVSSKGPLGPYERKGYVWSSGSHHGHNTSAAELLDGTYAVVVSEVVPFTIYKASSLDGPWTSCAPAIQTNGIKTEAGSCVPGGPCNDTHWASNVSLVARHDGKFEIVQRHGFIAVADTLCGTYLMQKPTWTYSTANRPVVDSVYPKRTSVPDPAVPNPTFQYEEDPVIWYSGCRYHVLYNLAIDRISFVLSSPDGIKDWRDDGMAGDPRMFQKYLGYEGNTTNYTKWFNMERPGVLIEDGHVTHVSWAVADVEKMGSIPGGSNHGSKIVVIPFDGATYDADTGSCSNVGTGGAGGGSGGQGGAGGAAGSSGRGGTSGSGTGGSSGGGRGGTSGSGTGGTSALGGGGATTSGSSGTSSGGGRGGSSSAGGSGGASSGTGGSAGSGTTGSGGSASGAGGRGDGGATTTGNGGRVAGSGGTPGSGGTVTATSGSGGASGGATSGTTPTGESTGGCSCRVGGATGPGEMGLAVALFLLASLWRRRRHASEPSQAGKPRRRASGAGCP